MPMLEKLLQLAQLCDTKLQKDLQSVLIKTAVWPVVKLNSMVSHEAFLINNVVKIIIKPLFIDRST